MNAATPDWQALAAATIGPVTLLLWYALARRVGLAIGAALLALSAAVYMPLADIVRCGMIVTRPDPWLLCTNFMMLAVSLAVIIRHKSRRL